MSCDRNTIIPTQSKALADQCINEGKCETITGQILGGQVVLPAEKMADVFGRTCQDRTKALASNAQHRNPEELEARCAGKISKLSDYCRAELACARYKQVCASHDLNCTSMRPQ